MADGVVTLTRDGPLGILTLTRPPVNSYDYAFVQDLAWAVKQVQSDDMIRVVVVRSGLEKYFSAGADVRAFSEGTIDDNMRTINAEHEVLEHIEQTPKIFLAMIGGHCLGGGLEIALACDLRFAGDGDFKIGLTEVNLGLFPGNGGTQRLPRLIGKSRAIELMLTGRTVSPQEAYGLGIVDKLIPHAELSAKTLEFANILAGGPTNAQGSIKMAVNQGLQMTLREGLANERALSRKNFQSEDAREGIRSFFEKRKPVFKGR